MADSTKRRDDMVSLGLGKIIKLKRVMMGLSQVDLAKRVDLSQSAVSRIEQQRSDPKLSHVVRILKELGIPSDKILVEKIADIEDVFS